MNNNLTKPRYFLNEDNFPIKMVPFDENVHPENSRTASGYFSYDNSIVVTRHWKNEENWRIDRYTSETTKEEFDLWVEYWKIYWEIEAAKEAKDSKLQSEKESELKKIDEAICAYRKKQREQNKRGQI